jgi:hypothetical protein
MGTLSGSSTNGASESKQQIGSDLGDTPLYSIVRRKRLVGSHIYRVLKRLLAGAIEGTGRTHLTLYSILM